MSPLSSMAESMANASEANSVGLLRGVLRDIAARAACANSALAVDSIRMIAEKALSVSDGYRFEIGDLVAKKRGYKFPGCVVMVGRTLAGAERVVVECTVDGVEGCLHIYSPDQLELTDGVKNTRTIPVELVQEVGASARLSAEDGAD